MDEQFPRPEVGRWPKAVALLLLAAAALYAICAVAVDLPSSPVQTRAAQVADYVIHPIFDQDWQLFAPTPATSNNLVEITAATIENGRQSTRQPFDIEVPLETLALQNHLLPTKMAGLTLAANEEWDAYRTKLRAIKSEVPQAKQQQAIDELNDDYRYSFDSLDRAASYYAHQHFPRATIVGLRVTFLQQDMVPFSQRYDNPKMPIKPLMETSWLPYIPDISGGS